MYHEISIFVTNIIPFFFSFSHYIHIKNERKGIRGKNWVSVRIHITTPACTGQLCTHAHTYKHKHFTYLFYGQYSSSSSSSSYIFHGVGHLLTRSGLTYSEVSSKVYHDSFCQLGSSVSLPWVISFEAFYLHVVSSFSCIPVICPKFVSF